MGVIKPVRASIESIAPLVYDAWYVIAPKIDFVREIKSITALGEPIIYYCTEAGDSVVMDGRCSHRRFPLAKGKLNGDAVSCGYHGITFAPDGSCTYAPGCPKGAPSQMRIKIYETVEAGPWIWAWMGSGAPDYSKMPMPEGVFEKILNFYYGHTHYNANYGLVHENLLDLSHIFYLHGAGTQAYNDAPLIPLGDGRAGWSKSEPNILSMFGMLSGAGREPMARWNILTEALAPGLMYTLIDFEKIDDVPNMPRHAMIMQAITPETKLSTHQFWLSGLDVPLAIPEEAYHAHTDFIHAQDVDALELQQRMINDDARGDSMVEISIPNDRSGLRFRQQLVALAAKDVRA